MNTPAAIDDFVRLVREMREAQRAYFKTKDRDILVRSKELERRVDAVLRDLEGLQL